MSNPNSIFGSPVGRAAPIAPGIAPGIAPANGFVLPKDVPAKEASVERQQPTGNLVSVSAPKTFAASFDNLPQTTSARYEAIYNAEFSTEKTR